MAKLAHIALAAALLTSSAVGGSALFPTAAIAQEKPWMTITYVRNGLPVGNTQVFCESPAITWGETTNYDYIHYAYHFMCP